MLLQDRIIERLQVTFVPDYLEVLNESHRHNVPAGSESHFKVTLVCEQFVEQTLLQRHQAVYQALAGDIQDALHALALHTFTLAEWQTKGQQAPISPLCRGGSAIA